jgi:radical SAM-linked protein
MEKMRQARLDALREIELIHQDRVARENRAERDDAAVRNASVVPTEQLSGHLNPSVHAASSAFRSAAEAPFSRLRLFYAKRNTACFVGQRDLLRLMPRMLRRARIELAYSRGYNPTPRMSFAPALPLGVAAEEEAVDIEVLLASSAEDMAGMLDSKARNALAADLIDRLRAVAPPGLDLLDVSLLAPGAKKLGRILAAADYSVCIPEERRAEVADAVAHNMAQQSLTVQREQRGKRGKKRAGPQDFDVRPFVLDATMDEGTLGFRLRIDPAGGARAVETVEALTGLVARPCDLRRERLLALQEGELVSLRDLQS